MITSLTFNDSLLSRSEVGVAFFSSDPAGTMEVGGVWHAPSLCLCMSDNCWSVSFSSCDWVTFCNNSKVWLISFCEWVSSRSSDIVSWEVGGADLFNRCSTGLLQWRGKDSLEAVSSMIVSNNPDLSGGNWEKERDREITCILSTIKMLNYVKC